MQLVKAGFQLGQAVKNAQRLRQIVSVFGKHGFVDVVERMNLGKFLIGRLRSYVSSQAEKSTPERLREAFEELGPAFIKLGQLLSTRQDLIPESFVEELVKLQDNVPALGFEVVREVVEKELGKPISMAYAAFSSEPLAAASIGQVHEAVLPTGETVVVKVQRPDIRKPIETDVSLLGFLANLLEKYVPESRVFAPKVLVEEFSRTLKLETNYAIEANNIHKISENLKEFQDIVIPKVYRSHSTARVLTLEKIEGKRFNDPAIINDPNVDKKHLVETGSRALFKTILIDGIFHGDLHGGNLFILPGNKLAIIDFGIVGRLSEKSRSQFANMVFALISEDYENLCYQYAELGSSSISIDFDSFQREVRNVLSPYIGLSMQDVQTGKLLLEATKIAAKYQIQVPGDWMLVFKSLITIEGMGRTLYPNLDIMKLGGEMVHDLLKNQYSPQKLSKEALWIARDVVALLQVLPRQIRWMFRKFNSNDFAFEIKVPELEKIRKRIDVHSKRMSGALLISALLISGSLTLSLQNTDTWFGYPSISIIIFSFAIILGIKNFFLR